MWRETWGWPWHLQEERGGGPAGSILGPRQVSSHGFLFPIPAAEGPLTGLLLLTPSPAQPPWGDAKLSLSESSPHPSHQVTGRVAEMQVLGQCVGGAEILGFQPAPRWCLGTTWGSEDLQEMNEETLTQSPSPSKDKVAPLPPCY